jgi:hypothetical protein
MEATMAAAKMAVYHASTSEGYCREIVRCYHENNYDSNIRGMRFNFPFKPLKEGGKLNEYQLEYVIAKELCKFFSGFVTPKIMENPTDKTFYIESEVDFKEQIVHIYFGERQQWPHNHQMLTTYF